MEMFVLSTGLNKKIVFYIKYLPIDLSVVISDIVRSSLSQNLCQ